MIDDKILFIETGSGRVEGTLEEMKAAIEYTVEKMVAIGSGLAIYDASPELHDFLMGLQKRYPPAPQAQWRAEDEMIFRNMAKAVQ